MQQDSLDPIRPEDGYSPVDKEISFVGDVYRDFYNYRTFRSGAFRQFQFQSLEEMWRQSRELFWNSNITASEDLANLGIQFSLPFTRKEVMDLVGRVTSLGVKPRLTGDALDEFGIKVLNGLYSHWRFKTNDKVEKFWQLLYGFINGTVCQFINYNNQKKPQNFLREYDPVNGSYRLEEKDRAYWNDVESYTVPIEDIYLAKVFERNIQKQGKVIWRTQMDPADFHREFQKFPDHIHVQDGNRIAEDSLYFRLLGGTGVTTLSKIEVLRVFDTDNDHYGIVANGIHLNKLGKGKNYRVAPNPFDHKMQPFAWAIQGAQDEKLAYGLPKPFEIKDPHKIMNAQWTMVLERELRSVDKPILSSDMETVPIIFGQKKVIPVGDVNAYKEIDLSPVGNDYFSTLNSMQNLMTGFAQGGMSSSLPSIQPKSAAEVDSLNQAKQQALSNTMLMYYDLVRQEMMLTLKTMLQYYSAEKYSKEEDRIVKSLLVPNMPLTLGGQGDLELRLVNKTEKPLNLFYQSIQKSLQNGRMTEIIEAPVDVIQNIEFNITGIDLEPEQTTEMKKAMFVQGILNPMLQYFVPAGVADIGKVYLRYCEAMGEHPADYSNSKVLPQLFSMWGTGYPNQNMIPQQQQQPQSQPPIAAGNQRGNPMGNLQQSAQGQVFGGQSNGGAGKTPFQSPFVKPMNNAQ